MNEELKPCPFCGKDPRVWQFSYANEGKFYVQCENPDCWLEHRNAPLEEWNNRVGESSLNESHFIFTLRGGVDTWGVEFVQWLEAWLDTIPGLERVGKSMTDEYIQIRMNTKTVVIQAGAEHKVAWPPKANPPEAEN